MKTILNRMLCATLLFSLFTMNMQAQEELVTDPKEAFKALGEFYKKYSQMIVSGAKADELKVFRNKFLSNKAEEKFDELVKAHDADPLIKAQDMTAESRLTLKIEPLPNDWYDVTYIDSYTKKKVLINVKVELKKKGYKITKIKE